MKNSKKFDNDICCCLLGEINVYIFLHARGTTSDVSLVPRNERARVIFHERFISGHSKGVSPSQIHELGTNLEGGFFVLILLCAAARFWPII